MKETKTIQIQKEDSIWESIVQIQGNEKIWILEVWELKNGSINIIKDKLTQVELQELEYEIIKKLKTQKEELNA